MASNHTPAYGLNQWVHSDNVLMADFNEDNAKIEQAILAAKPKFQSGTYVGTGTGDPENPTELTFDFPPQLLIVAPEPTGDSGQQYLGSSESTSPMIAIRGAATFALSYDDGLHNSDYNSAMVNLSWEGNTVRWYHRNSGSRQYNAEGLTYRYLAIG